MKIDRFYRNNFFFFEPFLTKRADLFLPFLLITLLFQLNFQLHNLTRYHFFGKTLQRTVTMVIRNTMNILLK